MKTSTRPSTKPVTAPSPASTAGGERLSEQLCRRIEDSIATGEHPPGARLDETELANHFKVSRTPIREALFQLEAKGLIEIRPRRGAIVREIPAAQLFEMFEVMAELEAMCARLAARRITPAELTALREAHLACKAAMKAKEADKYYLLNESFHMQIFDACHNQFLAEQTRSLHRRLSPYRRLQLRVRNRLKASYDEHEAVLKAISEGNSEMAAAALQSHVIVQGDRFTDLVASLKQFDRPA